MTQLDGPGGSLIIQTLRTIRWIFRPFDVLEEYTQRYGDTFFIWKNASPPVVYFTHPQAIQQIFTADSTHLESASGNGILLPIVGENSLFLLDGGRHQRQRRLLMPPFHGDRMRTYSEIINTITEQVISQWQIGKPFYVRSATQEITLRVILSAVFGLHQGERYQKLRQLFSSMLDSISSPWTALFLFFPSLQWDLGAWSPWGCFIRQRRQIDQLLYTEIRERRETADQGGEDILSLLLSARDEAGQSMSDEELRDELLSLLFAGHETTASALAWALYWIDYLPDVREKLLSELATLPADADSSTIARLPYLTAVCQETLRIYPIVLNPFPRIVKSPIEIMGQTFAPGTTLLPSIYLTHQREDIYPEPKRFKPERFLERQYSQYEYLPFGGGTRRCIGSALALFEMKLVLAKIISRCELTLADQRPIKPTRRGLTVAPPSTMRMKVTQFRSQKTPAMV
ncbi:Cytochrome P450 superfamily [Coleofasciculus chthonoplastes PCC 7420]|uniref:Cytochrome P450 superfamily n=1 Tax=Coleofasciculus chthonoplastes PCC 7420 TaxID=118168 RepID=B4W2S6_9CYAN|nr:cytochrome P450 [Coleofasciculus chthonoplastes]EDX71507.1 Cytochrome P450 superfamily [Coleofasciculus chthonoplastes PCC 7420]